MTATNKRQARPRGKKADRGAPLQKPREARAAGMQPAEQGRRPNGGTTAAAGPMQVKRREAARRIRGIADLSESLDVRSGLRRLAQQIAHGSRNVQGISFVETAIGECLDEAAATTAPRERWLLCEAATWGLAWLARTRRAGGSAGGLLERLVQAARAAQAPFTGRDTLPAVFVLTLARLFCDIEACRCLEKDASAALEEEIGRLTSADGTVALAGSPTVLERVVRWTAARDVALLCGSPAWDAATEARWTAAATASLRLLGGHGRVLIGAGRMPAAFSATLLEALAASPAKAVRKTAARLQEKAGKGEAGRRRKRGRTAAGRAAGLLPRDVHDAAAAVAVIRSGWEWDGLRVMVEYRDAVPRLEIAAGDRLLVDGRWDWSVTAGGRPLEAEGPWVLSCWESDRKATFFEIVAPLPGGMQIERQVVVVPRDHVVLLADAVTMAGGGAGGPSTNGRAGGGHGGEGLAYEGVVPLAPTLEIERAEETREVIAYDTGMRFSALPLGLPEWTATGRGTLTADPARGLVLRQQATGPGLHAPLWIDCDPARLGETLTWRQLTVADTRRNLQPHEAAGYRIQVGQDQWLLYRSLDAPRNRSVLGCNLSCEFLIGRIGRRGMVARTMEIQSVEIQ